MAKSGKLNNEQKVFIVQRLACFRTPTETAADVKEEFGIEISKELARSYNPIQVPDAKRWMPLFEATRKAFLESTAQIAIAQLPYRLDRLGRIALRASTMKNLDMEMRALEQAAKDVGGAFTNRRELSGKDGAPLMSGVMVLPTPVNAEEWSRAAKDSQEALRLAKSGDTKPKS